MDKIRKILLPDLGEGIKTATISEAIVSVGEKIKQDDIIMVLESDKASMEIPADIGGIVKTVNVKNGQEVRAGDLEITIKTINDEENKSKQTPKKQELEKPKNTTPNKQKDEYNITKPPKANGIYASPGVRRLARELEINLSTILCSGNKGRITKQDLHGYINTQMYVSKSLPPHAIDDIDFNQWGTVDIKKLTKIKKITGQRLTKAWQSIPHVTQFIESDATNLEALRQKAKTKHVSRGIKITMMPYLMKASVLALKEHPVFNSSLQNNAQNIVFKQYYHIGIAVNTKDGLMVPVIRDVDKKDILELSRELVDISERARNKRLTPNELKGGTFTISNLGGIGGSFFTPIINPPEVAILGVSRSSIVNKKLILPLSLSYDHRVIDGAAGASFMVLFSEILNNPQNFK